MTEDTFDLSALDVDAMSEKGAEVQLYHPMIPDTPLPIWITVVGPDSKKARIANREIVRQVSKTVTSKEKLTKEQELDQQDNDAAHSFARITVGWRGVKWDGEIQEFNYDNAVAFYRKHRWAREQVDRFYSNRANFFDQPS